MSYFWAFIATLILSVVFTGVVRNFAIKKNLAPAPRERDSHKKPIPRIGGVGMFLAFIAVSLVYFFLISPHVSIGSGHWFGIDKKLLAIWFGTTIIVISMLIDDIKGLPAAIKLIFQLAATAIVISAGIGIDSLTNPFGPDINLNTVYIPINLLGTIYHFSFWSDLLTLFWLIGMMNVINFIDGIDGLAAGISGIAAFIIFLLSLLIGQSSVAIIAIILSGATIGFLYWNFYPAKIFMGDCGSMFLGFMLGVLPLISGGKLATSSFPFLSDN